MEKEWYVIHTYAGYENKVKADLERRAASMNMEDNIFRIIVPMEDEIQVKDGKRKVISRKVFPGYVLVEMDLTDTSWYVVRNTPGVTGFVGTGNKPVPLSESEAAGILRLMGMGGEQKFKNSFTVGEAVRVIDGPFDNLLGKIEEVMPEKGKLKVLVDMFGRETQVEIDFSQVEKLL